MQSTSKQYGPPEGYYKITSEKQARDTLVEAVGILGDGQGKLALDLGCGAGRDTKYLLEHGYTVVAVDGSNEAWSYLKEFPRQDRLKFIRSNMEDFKFDKYDLVNASYSLPFANKNAFPKLFKDLKASLHSGGVFSGQLFGIHDQWNKPGELMTFLTLEEVKELLDGWKITRLEEVNKDGKLANGTPKHWHLFHIIAQKPV